MLLITVQVPEDRGHAAIAKLGSGMQPVAKGFAAASASSEIAAQHGNAACDPLRPWGHPAPGRYQLIAHGATPKGCEKEYGKHLLAFQPVSGAALDAESYGRLTLLAYGGPADSSGRLRRTQGGLRFDQKFVDALVARLAAAPEAILQIQPVRKPAWWQFWKIALPAIALSPEPPRFRAAPLDEASLAEALAAGKRRARPAPAQTNDNDWHDRDRSGSSSSSSSGDSSYAGRGGEYGGAGASGSWDKASPAGAGRGVDASGRISAAVAAAAAVASLQAADEKGDAGGPAATDGGATGTATGTNY
jgi:uncharacterized membrane protein YgcG